MIPEGYGLLSEIEDFYPLVITENGYSFIPQTNRSGIYEYEVTYFADDLAEPTSLFDALVFIVLDKDIELSMNIENVTESNDTALDPS